MAERARRRDEHELKRSRCTLIVCPLSVMDHWDAEMARHTTKGALVTLKYHGNQRLRDVERLTRNYNVVLTTYGCIQSEWRKAEDARLGKLKEAKVALSRLQRSMCAHSEESRAQMAQLKMKVQRLGVRRLARPTLSQILFRRIVLDEALHQEPQEQDAQGAVVHDGDAHTEHARRPLRWLPLSAPCAARSCAAPTSRAWWTRPRPTTRTRTERSRASCRARASWRGRRRR